MPSSGVLNPIVEGSITISSTAKNFRADFADFGITEDQVKQADVIHMRVSTSPIRYRYGGGTATNSTGFKLNTDSEIQLVGQFIIRNFSMIAESTDATVWFTLLKYGLIA